MSRPNVDLPLIVIVLTITLCLIVGESLQRKYERAHNCYTVIGTTEQIRRTDSAMSSVGASRCK